MISCFSLTEQKDIHVVLNWFRVNSMVANPLKFQIMFLGSKVDDTTINDARESKHVNIQKEIKLFGNTI